MVGCSYAGRSLGIFPGGDRRNAVHSALGEFNGYPKP
jgi:hypothetical protein